MAFLLRVSLVLFLAAGFGCSPDSGKSLTPTTGGEKSAAKPVAEKPDAEKPAAEKPAAGAEEGDTGRVAAGAEEPKKETTAPEPKGKQPDDDEPKPRVEMKTSLGTIVLELDRAKAPITVENFLRYVESKFYDGTIFHRVMRTFMIQGGGFDTEKKGKRPGRDPIKNESPGGLTNARGTVAMARTGDPDSATAGFYINVVDNGYRLDYPKSRGHGYAVFGRVIQGMDVVDKIKDVKILDQGGAFRNCPVKNVVLESARRIR